MPETSTSHVSRRTVVLGAAWSVPLVALAVAAPAAAASDLGAIAFSPSAYTNPDGLGYTTLTGAVTASGGVFPPLVELSYSTGFSGPPSAAVDPATGLFTVTNVTCPAAVLTGTITASAVDFASGTATLSVTEPAPRSGSIDFNPVQYRGTLVGSQVNFPTITGSVFVNGGALPATVILSFSPAEPGRIDLKRDAGLIVPIDPATGNFTVDGVYNSIVGGNNPFGFIYAGVEFPEGVTYGLATAELDG